MRDEHLFPEFCAIRRRDYIGRDPSQIAIAGTVLRRKYKRNERRPGLANPKSELPCQFVSECGSSDLGNGETAGCHYEHRRTKLCIVRADDKLGRAGYLLDPCAQE